MFNIFRLVLSLLIFMIPVLSHAHNSNIATFQIRHLDSGSWVYEVMTPLHGLDESLKGFINDEAKWSALEKGSAAYKEQLVIYLKDGFKVQVTSEQPDKQNSSSKQLSLGKGRIKLDDHLSVFIFEIKGMPKSISQLDFQISHMSNNTSQFNIFRLIEGQKSKKYVLNSKNNFSGSDKEFFN